MKAKRAEELVLMSVILNPDIETSKGLALELISELTVEHFTTAVNQEIFSRIKQNLQNGYSIELTGIAESVTDGCRVSLMRLLTQSITENIKHGINTLKTAFETSAVLRACQFGLMELTENPTIGKLNSVKDMLANAMVVSDNSIKDEGYIKDYLGEYYDNLRKKMSGEIAQGITFGIDRVDEVTGGAVKGDLVCVAGRSGMGKSSFAMTMITHQLLKGHKPLLVSLELGRNEIVDKTLSMLSEITDGETVPFQHINKPFSHGVNVGLNQTELNRLAQLTQAHLTTTDFYVRGSSRVTIDTVMSKARKLITEDGCDILYVDHIGLLVQNKDNATAELTNITNSLKLFASEMQIPVVVVVQLNRGADTTEAFPKLSHLKGSGSIEEDSSIVIFPFRAGAIDTTKDPSECQIVIAKSRNSDTGVIDGHFSTLTTIFSEADTGDAQQNEPCHF